VLLGSTCRPRSCTRRSASTLFYLRSVAPAREYSDKISANRRRGHDRPDLLGAVPFVVIQVIMVGIVIVFPGLVTGNVEKLKFDPSKVADHRPTPEYDGELDREGAAPGASPGTESQTTAKAVQQVAATWRADLREKRVVVEGGLGDAEPQVLLVAELLHSG